MIIEYFILSEISRYGSFTVNKDGHSSNMKVFSTNPFFNAIVQVKSSFECSIQTSNGNTKLYLNGIRDSYLEIKICGKESNSIMKLMITRVESKPISGFEEKKNVTFKDIFTVGHRGYGGNYIRFDLKENSIPSYKKALEAGADFIETDVQLTNDKTPIVHHNVYICSEQHERKYGEHLPEINDGYKYLISSIKTSQFIKSSQKEWNINLPTYNDFITKLPASAKFNVEIKNLNIPRFKTDNFFYMDRDEYLDIILNSMKKDTNREMYLQSFDMVFVLKLLFKQKRWPVFQLASKLPYEDSDDFHNRIMCFSSIFKYIGGKGFVILDVDIMNDPQLIKELNEMGFIIQTWGYMNIDVNGIINELDSGIRGIITDKLEIAQETVDDYRNVYNLK